VLLMSNPELLKLVLHEMGHALSMLLSAHASPHSVFGSVGYATTDVQELSAHVLERCVWVAVQVSAGEVRVRYATINVQELSAHVLERCVWVAVQVGAGEVRIRYATHHRRARAVSARAGEVFMGSCARRCWSCAGYATTEVHVLSAHVLERCVCVTV
jgi:hypothetical protein